MQPKNGEYASFRNDLLSLPLGNTEISWMRVPLKDVAAVARGEQSTILTEYFIY